MDKPSSLKRLIPLLLLFAAAPLAAMAGEAQYQQTKSLPVHESMAKVSNSIWETCKTYLFTQGRFLAILWVLIAACMVYYFMGLSHESFGKVLVILLCLDPGHPGVLRRGVVRHSHQHDRQLPHRLLGAARQSLGHALASRCAPA
jgi:Na+/H+-translocating membrane pyrophosphatase